MKLASAFTTLFTAALLVANPLHAAPSNDVHPFKIGDYSAFALRDGALQLPNDNKVFGLDHSPADVAAVLSAAGQPTDQLALSIQPLLVEAGKKVLLFDTGAGANMGATAGKLSGSLTAAVIDPAKVTDIFISHVHGDHVGGLVDAEGKAVFPNATIHLTAPEWEFLKGMNAESAKQVGISNYTVLMTAITPKVVPFAPGAELIPGIVKAVAIDGHTPGHSGYLIGKDKQSLLYVGDAVHHFVISVQKPDWHVGFDSDKTTGAASRVALIARSAASGQRIYAVHFPFPGLGKFVRKGDGFVWVAE